MGRVSKSGVLLNSGAVAFDFDWRTTLGHCISIEPPRGRLLPSQSMPISIEYHPVTAGVLREEKVQCRIQKGPCYDLLVNASAFKPKIKLGFEKHDFGVVFVRREGMKALETTLSLANKTKCELALHLYFESPHPDLTVCHFPTLHFRKLNFLVGAGLEHCCSAGLPAGGMCVFEILSSAERTSRTSLDCLCE